jgi:hypothetical protein
MFRAVPNFIFLMVYTVEAVFLHPPKGMGC